ncbi:MAG TPA: hypothetical protein VN638_07030, partial [Nitrospiraceae bacterium]|nr:hypothetical protein [Nitrospiraceae bacterium]
SLARKLDQAARLLSDSNPANDSSAANSLRAFVHEVMVLGDRQIAMEDSLALKSEAERLIEALVATSAGVTSPPRSLSEDAAPVRQTPARQ